MKITKKFVLQVLNKTIKQSSIKSNIRIIRLSYPVNLPINCPITVQIFSDPLNEKFACIEINPRFGGGYPMSYIAGADFPWLILKEWILDERILYSEEWEEGLSFLRYDQTLKLNNKNELQKSYSF